jgi:hypothetical protein
MNTEVSNVDARETFRPLAIVYRRRKRAASFIILPVFAFTGFAMFFLPSAYAWVGGACFIVLAIVADTFTPKLSCPVCRKKTDSKLDRFCPECGHESISKPSGFWSWPKCGNCGKQLVHARGRPYWSICYCTHCSAHLDDDGL